MYLSFPQIPVAYLPLYTQHLHQADVLIPVSPSRPKFVCAAEVYPTHVRATFQGISAASGKLGATIANILFGYVGNRNIFFLCAAACMLGFAATWLWLPDTTGLSLEELDKMSDSIFNQHFEQYRGEALNQK